MCALVDDLHKRKASTDLRKKSERFRDVYSHFVKYTRNISEVHGFHWEVHIVSNTIWVCDENITTGSSEKIFTKSPRSTLK